MQKRQKKKRQKANDSEHKYVQASNIFPCMWGFVVMISMYKNDWKWPSLLSTLHRHTRRLACCCLHAPRVLPRRLRGCLSQAFPPSPLPDLWWLHTRQSATVVSWASTDRPQYVKLHFSASFQRPLLTFYWIRILYCKRQKVNVKGKFKRPSDFELSNS